MLVWPLISDRAKVIKVNRPKNLKRNYISGMKVAKTLTTNPSTLFRLNNVSPIVVKNCNPQGVLSSIQRTPIEGIEYTSTYPNERVDHRLNQPAVDSISIHENWVKKTRWFGEVINKKIGLVNRLPRFIR